MFGEKLNLSERHRWGINDQSERQLAKSQDLGAELPVWFHSCRFII